MLFTTLIEEITTAFRRFGALIVDWPHKTESKAYFPPKGEKLHFRSSAFNVVNSYFLFETSLQLLSF